MHISDSEEEDFEFLYHKDSKDVMLKKSEKEKEIDAIIQMHEAKVVVWTDGACRNNQDDRFRRAGT